MDPRHTAPPAIGSDPEIQEESDGVPADLAPPVRKALQIAWPSFVMAGVMEALVFSVVDPGALRWFGGDRIDWPPQAVYTLSFFIFWLVIAIASAISHSLMAFQDDVRIGAWR